MTDLEPRRKILNENYDLTGISISRIFKHFLFSRIIPMGNYGGGPRLKPLMVFFLTHSAGRPLFWFTTRFERQMILLYRIINRLRRL